MYFLPGGGRAVQRARSQDDYMLVHEEADTVAFNLAPLKSKDPSVPCRPLVEAPDGLRMLDWSGQGLTVLPKIPTIYDNARVVNLQDNRLSDFPPELRDLHLMQSLRLDSNSIKSVPGYIASFSLLTDLRASDNSIATLSSVIGRCYHLTSCDLRNNRSTARHARPSFPVEKKIPFLPPCRRRRARPSRAGRRRRRLDRLPPSLGQCTRLTRLWLTCNGLESLPDTLSSLAALASLRAERNRLPALGFEPRSTALQQAHTPAMYYIYI